MQVRRLWHDPSRSGSLPRYDLVNLVAGHRTLWTDISEEMHLMCMAVDLLWKTTFSSGGWSEDDEDAFLPPPPPGP